MSSYAAPLKAVLSPNNRDILQLHKPQTELGVPRRIGYWHVRRQLLESPQAAARETDMAPARLATALFRLLQGLYPLRSPLLHQFRRLLP